MAFRFTTHLGTDSADIWTNICDTIYYALAGDDVMTGATGQNQVVLGGAGNDTYRPINNNLITIYDTSGTDRLEAQYINLDSKDTYWGTIEGQHLFFVDYSHAQGAVILDYKNTGIIETYVLGGKTYSHSELMTKLEQEKTAVQTQSKAYFYGDIGWDDKYMYVMPQGYSRADTVDGFAKLGVPGPPLALNATASDEMAALGTAHLGILRSAGASGDLIPLANLIDAGGRSMTSALNELIGQAAATTVAAIVMNNVALGSSPSSGKLDSLTAFAKMQHDSPGYQATGHAHLGGYEALGLAYAQTPEFAAKFGGGTSANFIASSYKLAFGREATPGQIDHFSNQYAFFTDLYTNAKFSEAAANLGARGAVVGQMFGFATEEAGNKWLGAANAFLLDASDGAAPYDVALAGAPASSAVPELI